MRHIRYHLHSQRRHPQLGWLPCLLTAFLLVVVGCSSIDCPVQNRVYTIYSLKKADGTSDTLKVDTLTITSRRVNHTDTTLQNRLTGISSFDLDISQVLPIDTLHLELRDTLGHIYRDTIWVEKSNEPHFESVDCQISYFHHITRATTTHHIIDSLSIHNATVNYEASNEHFHLYFKARY